MRKILLIQRGEGRKAQYGKIRKRVEESGYDLKILELLKPNCLIFFSM